MAARRSRRSTFGSIDKRGENKYRIRWTDKDGNKRSETISGPRFIAEDRLAEIRLGIYGGRTTTTFSMYWDEVVEPSMSNLEGSTVDGYMKTWRRLEPIIGDDILSAADWKYIQKVVDSFDAPSAQVKAKVLLKKIMNMAVRDRLIAKNPVDASIRTKQRVRRKKGIIYNDDILPWMWCVEGVKYEPIMLCILGAGLRPEEACALRWDDIESFEFKGRPYVSMEITKAIVMVDNKPVEKDLPKNTFSNRTAIMGDPFASRMAELMVGKDGPFCWSGKVDSVTGRKKPTSPATVGHNWKYWCERNGVVNVTMKDMRSSYSTNMGEAMAPDSVVAMHMGHTDGTTKGENYQQSTPRGFMRIADLYQDAIEEPWE